ncbi:MAG: heme ABC exporter ATP-binding protein CcmA [Alphaproteobacteria bacterium]|jgi:heme exporter protein A
MSLFAGHDLTCVRGERRVFAQLDFALEQGNALVLRGPNGSGKSSLLRLMAGLLRPAEGAVTWDGAPIDQDPETHHARLRYVGHLDGVKSALTVAENLSVWAGLAGDRPHGGDVGAALDRFGLFHLSDIPARMLSAGQRRRLALARALVGPAALWLLDEPTVALDAPSVAALLRAIAEHRAGGGMVVAATHADIDLGAFSELDLARHAIPWSEDAQRQGDLPA